MSTLTNRRAATFALLATALLGAAPAQAQEFPNRPIRIVVGFGAGIGMEVSTRLLAELMAQEIGQPVIVENKPGAATMIAATAVASAPKDGYTLLMLNNQTINNSLLYKKVPYKNSDFVPIAAGGLVSMVMAVSKTVPATTGREFIDYAKANPGRIFYGFWGAGGSPHLLAARLAASAGLDLQGVGYKDPAQATADLVTGRIQLFFTSATHGLGLLNAGHARITCPTLVIAGSRDEATPPAMSQAIAQGIAGAQLRSLDAAHLSAVEQPEAFARLLLDFWQAL